MSVCVCVCIGNGESHLPEQIFPGGGVLVCRDYKHDLSLYRALSYMADPLHNMLAQGLICVFLLYC